MRRHTTRHLVLAAVTALAAAGMVLAPITGTSVARADAVIYVTTTAQKIGGPGGCSLEEAILAANHDSSSFAAPGNDSVVINSGCTAGNGADTIVLAQGAVYQMGQIIDDLYNEMGPTATPVITSPIAISGSGAVIERTTTSIVRAFAVGQAGSLALSDVDVRGFAAHGGRGAGGGGGGLGAGGAIYVHGGSLLVQSSTFEGNGASGGDGSGHGTSTTGFGYGGGGGGLGGNGGYGSFGFAGGGGGSRGNGAAPGGGGGTLTDGTYPDGGARCGGDVADGILSGDGEDGQCDGGGGGGGASGITGGDGGTGAYGGGGGGGADDGGHGGFGGGGGGGDAEQTLVYGTWEVLGGGGGDAGFGGGGGAGPGGLVFGGPGSGGTFGGNATKFAAGGGAGLGGAIFGNSASITVINSTFTGNYAVRGVAGGSGADNGADAGGAIFTVGGSLSVNSSTISGNDSTGDGAGIVVYKPTTGEATSLSLYNTIIAGNGSSGGNHDECFVRGGVAVVGANNLITPHATDALTPCPGITQTGDPLLSALALNAPGTTPTMALDAASPAVDAGDAAMSPLNDQRGVGRPQGNGPDVGAYELITDFTAPLATPTQNPRGERQRLEQHRRDGVLELGRRGRRLGDRLRELHEELDELGRGCGRDADRDVLRPGGQPGQRVVHGERRSHRAGGVSDAVAGCERQRLEQHRRDGELELGRHGRVGDRLDELHDELDDVR